MCNDTVCGLAWHLAAGSRGFFRPCWPMSDGFQAASWMAAQGRTATAATGQERTLPMPDLCVCIATDCAYALKLFSMSRNEGNPQPSCSKTLNSIQK